MATGEWEDICSNVSAIADLPAITKELDAIILAAGFEERAFRTLPEGSFSTSAHCILIRFANSAASNEAVFERFMATASQKFASEAIHIVDLAHGRPQRFEADFRKTLSELPRTARRLGIDVSGIPSHAICIALKTMRDQRSEESQLVLYTAADDYNPSREEYDKLLQRDSDEIELLPKSMALEMAENLVLDTFSGYRSQNAKSCLVVFAGFEAHRSTGVVEAVNPSLLLLFYGKPGDSRLGWRLDLSRKLHRKFEKSRRTATEEVSTLHVKEALDRLETYYDFLIDDYDLVISPICSKMHVIASYMFWEKYQETQLTFPIPIGYDPANCPRGIAKTYGVSLGPRRGFFRIKAESVVGLTEGP